MGLTEVESPVVLENAVSKFLKELKEKIAPVSEDTGRIKILVQLEPTKRGEFVQHYAELPLVPKPDQEADTVYKDWPFTDKNPIRQAPGTFPKFPATNAPNSIVQVCQTLEVRRSLREGLLDNHLEAEYDRDQFYSRKCFLDSLRNAKPKNQERLTQYMHRMIRLGYRGEISPRLIMKFIVDGVDEDPANKDDLYDAENFEELGYALEKLDRKSTTKRKFSGLKKNSKIPKSKIPLRQIVQSHGRI